MSASNIMLVCKREKFSGPRVRNMRAFGNFSSDIPRRDMPDNNFTGHARIYVMHISRERLTGKSLPRLTVLPQNFQPDSTLKTLPIGIQFETNIKLCFIFRIFLFNIVST